ncbi:hypothetical protein WJX84_003559 [Apatococcus fuscideae]|uniref:Aromatic amino acid beta-eliminating lyase/threonine aldolase domain-containing protein n=1 Tax=Apatococcus fuscideae TaxID=2026836 RepID=A0AAW1T823_9CHLO
MAPRTVDLRSDTLTHPTDAMREAMAKAPVGDDVYAEDPTVNELQEMAAELMGKEAALLVPTGTMGNLTAILAHCERGAEILVGDEAHIYVYEAGGASALGGVAYHVIPNAPNGELPIPALQRAVRPIDQHAARTSLICIENTHNRCGGAVLSLQYLADLKKFADSRGLPVHMDGARVFNAAAALDVHISEIAKHVTTIQFCLSKGLAAPIGSMVAGPKDFIEKVHRWRKMLGGGMRQAGVIAAPGMLALTDMTKRLHEDHENATLLAEGLSKIDGIVIDKATVHSNIVLFVLAPSDLSEDEFLVGLKQQHVRMIQFGPRTIRAVTHWQISEGDIRASIDAVAAVVQQGRSSGIISAMKHIGLLSNGYGNGRPASITKV